MTSQEAREKWQKIRDTLVWTKFSCKVCMSDTYADYKIDRVQNVEKKVNGKQCKVKTRIPCVRLHCTCGWSEIVTLDEFDLRGGSSALLTVSFAEPIYQRKITLDL